MSKYLKASSVLDYNKETGEFIWKENRGGLAKKGSIAGSIDTKGYVQIKIDGSLTFAHRLAWFFVYGVEPSMHIDHIDRNPRNNAIANLRLCTHSQNHQNIGTRKNSTSGVTGVSFIKASKKWLAYINVDGKRIRVGFFDNFDEAVKARLSAKKCFHTFHPSQLLST